MLYIVATPIGNLGDITLRAIEVIKNCDFVIAENPGYSKRLMQHIDGLSLGVIPSATEESLKLESNQELKDPSAPPRPFGKAQGDLESNRIGRMHSSSVGMTAKKEIVQFAEFNEQQIVKELARRLIKEDGCLISDAGTPGISDPGFRLVRECVKENVQVVPVPGANAAIAALSASGLPTDRFIFLGFLQKTAAKTLSALQAAANAEATAIFYESPERVIKTLSYIANAYPASQVVAAREITKMHEEFIRGSAGEVLEKLKEKPSIKGEFTVLVSFK
jgi:16S rRNA (cytidine(1402)-2'-O)-methyltransferase